MVLLLHHNRKVSASYHKNGLVSSYQSLGRWFIKKLICSRNILTKLVGYQQYTCLCVRMEFVVGIISLSREQFSLSSSCIRSCGTGTGTVVYGK